MSVRLHTSVMIPAAGLLLALLATACASRATPLPATPMLQLQSPVPLALPEPIETLQPSPAAPQNFSLESMNPLPPQDVLKQLAYFGGAGPGPCDSWRVEWTPGSFFTFCPQDHVEPLGNLRIWVSEQAPDSQAQVVITYPDGRRQEHSLPLDQQGSGWIDFIPGLDDPIGEYGVSVTTQTGMQSGSFQVEPPSGPRLILIPEENRLQLFGFAPHEAVQLLLYSASMENCPTEICLQGWQPFEVDANGRLPVNIPPGIEPYFVAVGEQSGAAYRAWIGAKFTPEYWAAGDVFCPGAPPPLHLQYESLVQTILPEVPIRTGFNLDTRVATLPTGSVIQLLYDWGSPMCIDGAFWWRVTCTSGEGDWCQDNTPDWLPESLGGAYTIEALPDGGG